VCVCVCVQLNHLNGLEIESVAPQPRPRDLADNDVTVCVRNANLAAVRAPRHVSHVADVPIVDHLLVPLALWWVKGSSGEENRSDAVLRVAVSLQVT
jgi:hypothetical protein